MRQDCISCIYHKVCKDHETYDGRVCNKFVHYVITNATFGFDEYMDILSKLEHTKKELYKFRKSKNRDSVEKCLIDLNEALRGYY